MQGNDASGFFIVVFMILLFVAGLYFRTFLTKRAIFRVIRIFYEHNALKVNTAKTPRELGLEFPDFLHRLLRPRDYKQHALYLLIKKGIVFENDDGRLYMDEKNLEKGLRSKTDHLRPQKKS